MSTINVRQLECFLAVAEELHFARAAERLHLSPASVSEAVGALERRVGGRLFDRSTRRVCLTRHGSQFLADVRGPFDDLLRAHEVARARASESTELVIAHTPELGQLLLPPLLGRHPPRPASPGWRPTLQHTLDQLVSVREGSADVGLCWSATVHPPLSGTVLGGIGVVAILRGDDPLAGRASIPLADLRSRSLLMTPRGDNPFVDAELRAEFVRAGIPETSVDEVRRYDELVLQVAAAGRIGVHPATIMATNRVPGVEFRPLVAPALTVTICAVTREDRQDATKPVVEALGEIVSELDLVWAPEP